MARIKIRPASKSDLDEVSGIEDQSFPTPYPKALLARLLKDCPETFLVAEDERGKLLGYCVASLEEKYAHLISIAVKPAKRRAGVGGEILNALTSRLFAKGVQELWLEVKSDNAEAIALYERNGFVRGAILPRYYQDGSDAIRMSAPLKDATAN